MDPRNFGIAGSAGILAARSGDVCSVAEAAFVFGDPAGPGKKSGQAVRGGLERDGAFGQPGAVHDGSIHGDARRFDHAAAAGAAGAFNTEGPPMQWCSCAKDMLTCRAGNYFSDPKSCKNNFADKRKLQVTTYTIS